MDAAELVTALYQLGPVGIVLIVLGAVTWQWRNSLKQGRTENDRLKTWYVGELERQEKDHDSDISRLQSELRSLKEEVAALRASWESERSARMAAEETAHQLRMGKRCSECGKEEG